MSVQYHRTPCPGRIFEDLGGGFLMGCGGGSIMYFFKGLFNSPSGQRIRGGIKHLRMRAPVIGGSFAMWAGCFATCECTLIYFRQKDDPLNAIAGGIFTGGLLAIRGGLNIALKNAIFGGLILSIIEGVGVIFTAVQTRNRVQEMEEMQKKQLEMYQQQMGISMPSKETAPKEVASKDEAEKSSSDKYGQLADLAPQSRQKSFQF